MNDYSYGNDVPRGAATGFTMSGFLMGALVGAGIALLLAPAPGGETRRKLGETARRLRDAAGERFGRSSDTEPETSGMEQARREPGRREAPREPLAGTRTPRPGTTGPA